MRPHALRLSAFGPFPGEVEVDLDALAAGGLFLLHGQTGAGKTTLLDAMCFALYGQVPGERGTRRLRSDHADPGARCSVTLELTVGGRRLRVTRTPAFDRPKKRGAGTITEQPTVRVEELRADRWRTWSTRPGEADLEIADLLGMSAEQFCRVVLLPQGMFAAFLHADATERTALLERLFATDRFRDVEQWLAQHRRAVADRCAAAGGELDALAARVAQAAGVELPPGPDLAWYDATLTAAEVSLAAARADAVAAAAAAETAARAHRNAERLADRQARRLTAQGELAVLLVGAELADAARDQLAAARRAAPLVPLADRADRARQQAESAAADASVRRRLAGGGDAEALTAARRRLAQLEALAPQAELVTAQTARAAEAEAARADAAGDRAAVAASLAELPRLRADAVAAHADALAATLALPEAEREAGRLAALVADAEIAAVLTDRLAAARAEETTARERAVAAGEAHLAVRTALLAGQAARLAADLADGQPCAVCGATEHPAPAVGGGEVPGEQALEAADSALREAEAVRATAGARVAGLDAELRTVTVRLAAGGWSDVHGLAAARSDADGTRTALTMRAAALDDAAAAMTGLDEQSAKLTAEDARLAALESAATAVRDESAAAAARGQATLRVTLDGAADLAAALAAAGERVGLLGAAVEADAVAARHAAAAAADAAELATALRTAGLADTAALRRDALPAATVSDLEAKVASYELTLAAARTVLADPELVAAPADPVDVASVGAAADALARTRDEAAAVAAVAAERARAVADLGPGLRTLLALLGPLLAERDEVAGLAELARGANPRGMRLSTYVLAARLEQVAAAATARLLPMTDGRYTLRHTDVRADRRTRGGLGLVVHDAWTGSVRDTGTLSGGETFVASLALALGLADTVTAEAGGAPIEALFVDEGFGSLDEDTLEEVMDVLDGLRSGGRVVGIVSHVADLRRRIPAQLHVRKGRAGSTLERLGA